MARLDAFLCACVFLFLLSIILVTGFFGQMTPLIDANGNRAIALQGVHGIKRAMK